MAEPSRTADAAAVDGPAADELNALLSLGLVSVEIRDGKETFVLNPDLLDQPTHNDTGSE